MEDKDRLNPGEVNSEEDFASLLAQYEGASQRLRPGKVVQGKIVSVFTQRFWWMREDALKEF